MWHRLLPGQGLWDQLITAWWSRDFSSTTAIAADPLFLTDVALVHLPDPTPQQSGKEKKHSHSQVVS